MALTDFDEAKKYAQANPNMVSGAGVANISQVLQTLKQGVMDGKMSVTEFQGLANPLIKTAQNITQIVASQGSAAANSVNPYWQQLQTNGFVGVKGGQWTAQLPFSQQEYAKLPNNVLPTQTDVQNGLFDPTSAPFQRFQTATGGSTNQPVTVTQPTAVTGPNGQPLPQINPSIPAGTNTQTDQGQAALQGAQNAAQLQDALNKQLQVNQQAVGQLGTALQGIPDIFRNEGQSQQAQLQALADSQKSARAQSLTDLGSILAQNQMNQFNRAIPDLAEQANTAGIYRSTGFGNILAQKYANLTADTQTQLALQGIADRNAYLQQQQQALGTQLGFSGQGAQAQASGQQTIGSAGAGALQAYGAGLGDVANAQIGMQNAGLQRQFSLQDYATQYSNALNLANQAKTQGPTGKASPGTQAAIGSIAMLGNTAGSAYSGMQGKGGAGTPGTPAYSPQFGNVFNAQV